MDYNVTYRKKDKGLQCIISYKDNLGKWRQKSKQGFKAQKDAKSFISETVKKLEIGLLQQKDIVNFDYATITFKQLSDEFVEHSKLYKEYNTVKGYTNTVSKLKLIHDIKVCNLKKADLIKCIDKMVMKGLRYETLSTYIRRIKLIFDYYKDNYDPNFSINLNFKLSKDKDNDNKKALTKSQLDALLKSEKLKKSKFYIVAYIAANTGLRCGEILGLTWNDIDEVNLTLDINKQWKKLKNGKNGIGVLKSKNSYRKVPITQSFITELKCYKSKKPISIDNRIAPFNKASIEKYLNSLLYELARVTLHELRHTYITLLIANGVDFKTVAKIAGHDVKQTLNTYSHVNDDMMKNASKIISKIF
ncbi:MAG: site-specific integrase [Clostridium butyricum]|nr:site-specific integrase [Clostridium butyricum]